MIKYLGELSLRKNTLIFLAEAIPEEYSKMLEIKIDGYHEKTTYMHTPFEVALIFVELDPSKVESSPEYIISEARDFVKWYNIVINEVVIDNYILDR